MSSHTLDGLNCEWSAVQDLMPPRPPRLRVRGVCTMPTPGYRLYLTRAEPQGTNPAILLLDLHVEPPNGPVIQVLTPTPVDEYEEEGSQRFTEVQIMPKGTLVPVEPVH